MTLCQTCKKRKATCYINRKHVCSKCSKEEKEKTKPNKESQFMKEMVKRYGQEKKI